MTILLLWLSAWWIKLYAGNVRLRLIRLNVIQTLLYQHQPTEVSLCTTWKELRWKIGLCSFTKLSRSLLGFLICFVISLCFPSCGRAKVSASLYRIKTIDSSWYAGHVWLSNSGTNIVILAVSNFIRSKFIYETLWSLRPVARHNRIANLYDKVYRSHSSIEDRDFIYLKHIETSDVVVYHGRDGLRLKTSFSNLHTKGSSLNEVPFLDLRMEGSTDFAVFNIRVTFPCVKVLCKVFYNYFKICLSSINIPLSVILRELRKWPWCLYLVVDFHDVSIMPAVSSDAPLFSVKNLLSERPANLSSSIWGPVSLDVGGRCSRWFLEISRTGASVSIFNIRGNHDLVGTVKVSSAVSASIFFKTFRMIENGGKALNLRELQSTVTESTPEASESGL